MDMEERLQNKHFWEHEESKLDDLIGWALQQGESQLEQEQPKPPMRQLIRNLIDVESKFYEFGTIAGIGLNYPGLSDIPYGGVITGIGKICGNWTMIIANDSRIKGGTYFPITIKKYLRAQSIAELCSLNSVYIMDSSSFYLPMQSEIFPDENCFGTILYRMARMTSKGLKQIVISTGYNTGIFAYLPSMATYAIAVDKMFFSYVGGPSLVKSVTGEVISSEDLGGAWVHTQLSGNVDFFCRTLDEAIIKVREVLSTEPPQQLRVTRYAEVPPAVSIDNLYETLPSLPYQGINAYLLIQALIDDSTFVEYKKFYAPGRGDNIVTGRARIKGLPVGIVASNGLGIITVEAAKKSIEWITKCCCEEVPILFIQSSPGYMVGSESEYGGIGKYGADMIRAISYAQVPRIQLVVGVDIGMANYSMSGRATYPHFIFGTMRARTSIMNSRAISEVLLGIEDKKRNAEGKSMSEEEKKAFMEETMKKYEEESHPFYMGARMVYDEVLKFRDIREWLALALEVSLLKPSQKQNLKDFRF